MYRKIFLSAVAVAAFALPGMAQDSKLNGQWTLNLSKSNFGQLPPPASENDTITVKGNSFRQEYVTVTSRGTQNVLRSCTVDGKEVENPDSSQVNLGGAIKLAKMQCSWDGKAVVFLETVNMQGGVLTDKITFIPSDDGSTITIAGHIESPVPAINGDRKYVFDKSDGSAGAAAAAAASSMAPTPGAAAMIHTGGGDPPSLSGTWKLNVAKSNYGQIPPPASQVDTIDDSEPTIKITVDQKGGMMGDSVTTSTLDTSGKETKNGGNGMDVLSTAHWQGAALVVDSKASMQGTDMKIKETYTVSGDGKTLTDVLHIESGMGNFDLTSVYDKQ
ncbi:MAG TPA: hypothetical protein VMM16_04010 [Verrucomicrobiae bacterium]|nr:hypothetical protein [Verrucomicrobiae bacterium]